MAQVGWRLDTSHQDMCGALMGLHSQLELREVWGWRKGQWETFREFSGAPVTLRVGGGGRELGVCVTFTVLCLYTMKG